MRKSFLLLLTNAFFFSAAYSQQTTPLDSVISLLKQVRAAYDSSHNLNFNIFYTQAAEDAPTTIVDSLSGKMQISHGHYHWTIGNTEVTADRERAVMLFKDDKVMYITKSCQAGAPDPLANLDSSLLYVKDIQCTVTVGKNVKTISIVFPKDYIYKNISVTVDRKTGYITKSLFIAKSDALQTASSINDKNEKPENAYYYIEAKYSNYDNSVIDDSIFNQKNYFIKTDKGFETTTSYSDYKIFIGSPNL